MSKMTPEEIRRMRLNAIKNKINKNDQKENNNNSTIYYNPFHQMGDNDEIVIRFLPPADIEKYPEGYIEVRWIHFEFNGIVGLPDVEKARFSVPSILTWVGGKSSNDPICAYINDNGWFEDPDMKSIASRFWPKSERTYSCMVVKSDIKEENAPHNPIRLIRLKSQIYKILDKENRLLSVDDDYPFDDVEHGSDFHIIKTKEPSGYYGYSDSFFSRRSRPLNEEELAAIDAHGLITLGDFLPQRPTDDQLEYMVEMLEAAVSGDPYDPARFGHLPWKPWQVREMERENGEIRKTPSGESSRRSPKETKVKSVVSDDSVSEKNATESGDDDNDKKPTEGSISAQELLARIRANQ